jgi:signal transduction histidine kinase
VLRIGGDSKERWGDILVVLLLLAGVAEIVFRPHWGQAGTNGRLADASMWLELSFAPLWSLPLLARRRSGLAAGITVAAAIAVLGLIANPATESSVMFVAYLAGSAVIGLYEERVPAVAGGIAIFALLLVVLSTNPGGIKASDVFVGMIFASAPLAAGQVVRELTNRAAAPDERARELERQHAAQAEAAAAEERDRIANELHDVIAHGVSVMTVQASGARLLLRSDPARAREAIEAVEHAGREALAETRRLLGILRRDPSVERSPQPGIGDLEGLIEGARAAGLTVSLRVEGEPCAVSPSVGLAAFRVVSDACEFTRDAGGVSRADVVLRWLPGALEIEVAGDGTADYMASGRLIARVTERIRLYDGSLETRRRDDGAGVFIARIPLEASS